MSVREESSMVAGSTLSGEDDSPYSKSDRQQQDSLKKTPQRSRRASLSSSFLRPKLVKSNQSFHHEETEQHQSQNFDRYKPRSSSSASHIHQINDCLGKPLTGFNEKITSVSSPTVTDIDTRIKRWVIGQPKAEEISELFELISTRESERTDALFKMLQEVRQQAEAREKEFNRLLEKIQRLGVDRQRDFSESPFQAPRSSPPESFVDEITPDQSASRPQSSLGPHQESERRATQEAFRPSVREAAAVADIIAASLTSGIREASRASSFKGEPNAINFQSSAMSEGFNQNGNPLSPKSDSDQTVKQESYRGASGASTPRLENNGSRSKGGSIAFEGDRVTARSAMPRSQTPSNRPESTHSGPVGLALGGPSGDVEDLSAMSAKQSARSNSRPHSIAVRSVRCSSQLGSLTESISPSGKIAASVSRSVKSKSTTSSVKEGLVAPNTKAGSNAESCKDGSAALGSKASSVAPTAKSGSKAQSCKDGSVAPSSKASSVASNVIAGSKAQSCKDPSVAPSSKASSVASNVIAGSKAQSCKDQSVAPSSKASLVASSIKSGTKAHSCKDEFAAPGSKALSVASNVIAGLKAQSCKDEFAAPGSKASSVASNIKSGSKAQSCKDGSVAPSSKASSVASNVIAGSKAQSCKDGSVAPSSKASSVASNVIAGSKAQSCKDQSVAPSSKASSVASNVIAGSKAQSCKDGSVAPSSKASSVASNVIAGSKAQSCKDPSVAPSSKASSVVSNVEAGSIAQSAREGSIAKSVQGGTVAQSTKEGSVASSSRAESSPTTPKVESMQPESAAHIVKVPSVAPSMMADSTAHNIKTGSRASTIKTASRASSFMGAEPIAAINSVEALDEVLGDDEPREDLEPENLNEVEDEGKIEDLREEKGGGEVEPNGDVPINEREDCGADKVGEGGSKINDDEGGKKLIELIDEGAGNSDGDAVKKEEGIDSTRSQTISIVPSSINISGKWIREGPAGFKFIMHI
ncbi:hypothetical protein BY996DRAFT_6414861 [Phakopsora pachyrhizi]|nr:hypothetical protein BY996DRAFT_6414861 [Phakopsora pachyrhizi]